jgi:hypothetical protein
MMTDYYQPMKLFINILFISFLISTAGFSQDCKSRLVIETDLILVEIFINDSLVATSRYYETELDSGWYKISLIENSDRWNSVSFFDSVFLSNCKTIKLNYKKENKVYLDTSPQDAYVFSGDSLLGNTPIFIEDNLDDVKLIKPGYAEENLKLENIAQQNLITLTSLQLPKEESFFYSSTFHILAATAVALGAFSAYYKLKADDSYDEYQFTGDQKLLDDTNRYDLISGITFTALQINFGFIIYKFLTE